MNPQGQNNDIPEITECIVCGKPLTSDRAICKLKQDGLWVAICCPHCYDSFQKKSKYYINKYMALKSYKKIWHGQSE